MGHMRAPYELYAGVLRARQLAVAGVLRPDVAREQAIFYFGQGRPKTFFF